MSEPKEVPTWDELVEGAMRMVGARDSAIGDYDPLSLEDRTNFVEAMLEAMGLTPEMLEDARAVTQARTVWIDSGELDDMDCGQYGIIHGNKATAVAHAGGHSTVLRAKLVVFYDAVAAAEEGE